MTNGPRIGDELSRAVTRPEPPKLQALNPMGGKPCLTNGQRAAWAWAAGVLQGVPGAVAWCFGGEHWGDHARVCVVLPERVGGFVRAVIEFEERPWT